MDNKIIIYQNSNNKIVVKLFEESVWITQDNMVLLFDSSKSNISEHIKNIINSGELQEESVVRNFRITAKDNKNYNTKHYNLDMILSVGYKVNSTQAIHFRQWATQILKEYLIKGFVIDDERLKGKDNNYFDELLERIRDIRSSEKIFYRKILEIYATSIDYDPTQKATKDFFATIQNKMHWATHGKTASELVFERANAKNDFMGITTTQNVKKSDIKVAKNYLNENELKILNRIVNMYLDFAELQALEKKQMTMQNWIDKLNEFLKITNKQILTDKGTISKLEAEEKAIGEYDKYKERVLNNELSIVEKHFLENLEKESKKIKDNKLYKK